MEDKYDLRKDTRDLLKHLEYLIQQSEGNKYTSSVLRRCRRVITGMQANELVADDGGPAFPAHDYVVGDISTDQFQKLGESRGMTLRAWLAGKALTGLLAAGPDALQKMVDLAILRGADTRSSVSRIAVAQADAVIQQLKKGAAK